MPLFLLSVFTVPVHVAEKIEQITYNFLLGMTNEAKHYHLLSWDLVCLPREWGRLGLRRIRDMNASLLTKWLWRLISNENSLWKKIIRAKYGTDARGRFTNKKLSTHGCSVWKGIEIHKGFVEDNMSFKLGAGTEISFWNDIWCDKRPLKFIFPQSYRDPYSKKLLYPAFSQPKMV